MVPFDFQTLNPPSAFRARKSALPSPSMSVPINRARHFPDEQLCPGPQILPQVPQLFGSVCRLRQAELHIVSPLEHTHEPAAHVWSALHTLPQEPQWVGSVCVLTHCPEHTVKPPVQLPVHIPAVQDSPGAHGL